MRKDYNISITEELGAIDYLSNKLITDNYSAANCVVCTVSTDYSSIAGQIIRHKLSNGGEIADGFGIDVPYPDQTWDDDFIYELSEQFRIHEHKFFTYKNKTLLLVESAVIRGGNYKFLKKWIGKNYPDLEVLTLSLYENKHSVFKSDYVYEYYDNTVQDITFDWEENNSHWV